MSRLFYRLHYRKDLKPFCCLSELCEASRPSFESRGEWQKHMESVHSAAWPQTIHQHQMWECDHLHHKEEFNGNIIHALNKFSTTNDLEHHYLLHHGRRASSQADPAGLQRPQSSEHDDQQDTCPLCCFEVEVFDKGLAVTADKTDEPGSAIGKVQISTLEQHIAAHLQYLMVVSLRLRSVLGLHFDEDGDDKSHEADSSMSSPGNPHAGGNWDEDLPLITHGSQSEGPEPDSQALEESAADHLLMDEDSRASAGELNIPDAAMRGSIADADEWADTMLLHRTSTMSEANGSVPKGPTVLVRAPTAELSRSSTSPPIGGRASAEEMDDEMKGIYRRATTDDGAKIDWMKFEEPVQVGPDASQYREKLTESDALRPMSTTSRNREVRKQYSGCLLLTKANLEFQSYRM